MAFTIALGYSLLHLIYVVQFSTSERIQNATGGFYFNYPRDIDCLLDNCVVICNEENGCKGLTINAKYAKYLYTIECSALHSCDSMSLTYGSFSNISIKCTGDMSCVDAHFETYPTKGVFLKCLNEGTGIPCYRTSISAHHEWSARAEVSCQGSPGCKNVNFQIGSFKSQVSMD
eukprot:895571_1